MLDRQSRINRHIKASRPQVSNGAPGVSEGINGDVTYRQVGGSLSQYVKKDNKWHEISGGAAETQIITVAGGGTGIQVDIVAERLSNYYLRKNPNTKIVVVTANNKKAFDKWMSEGKRLTQMSRAKRKIGPSIKKAIKQMSKDNKAANRARLYKLKGK